MSMKHDKELIVHKLERWERYLSNYSLPAWKEIPDIGLYMDQVVVLLSGYLNFIPEEVPTERPITPTTINNYVRLKVMPAPERRKYYRRHIVYLITIFTLKQSASIASVQRMLPLDLTQKELELFYGRYVETVEDVAAFFTKQTREGTRDILAPGSSEADDAAIDRFIIRTVLMGGFSGILAQKLLFLQGADREEVLRRERESEEGEAGG